MSIEVSVSLEELQQSLAEARADEARKDCAVMCPACGNASWHPAQWKYDKWMHLCTSGMKTPIPCAAAPIHERLYRAELENARIQKENERK